MGNLLDAEDLDLMAADRIVFAMANPDPSAPQLALSHCRIFATGRSDFPNQINNALAFRVFSVARSMCRPARSTNS